MPSARGRERLGTQVSSPRRSTPMTLLTPDPVELSEQRDAYAGRWMTSMLGTVDLLTAYIGDRLGLYQALGERGPLTSEELADATSTHERYVREWLEQQAV